MTNLFAIVALSMLVYALMFALTRAIRYGQLKGIDKIHFPLDDYRKRTLTVEITVNGVVLLLLALTLYMLSNETPVLWAGAPVLMTGLMGFWAIVRIIWVFSVAIGGFKSWQRRYGRYRRTDTGPIIAPMNPPTLTKLSAPSQDKQAKALASI